MFSEFSLSQIAIWQCFFAIGIVLMLLEICLPAFFLLWIGIACLFTAGTLAIWVLGPIGQVLCFFGFSVISLIAGYLVYERKSTHHMVPNDLNSLSENLIGQLLTLEHSIASGNGEQARCYISINDTRWAIRSISATSIEAGAQVRIVSIKGNTLMVDIA